MKIVKKSYNFLGEIMKQGFQILGIITLLVGSFWYSKEVDTVAKLSDDLLNEIKLKAPNYKKEAVLPIMTKETIIPGINGQEVDINKSYNAMREIGYFDEKMIKYKDIKIKDELKENQDKYIISGNKKAKKVALIFKVTDNHNLNKIIRVLKKEKVTGTFFIESDFLEKNYLLVANLIKAGHTIGNLSKNEDYNHPDFIWLKTVILNAGQHNNYCYTKIKNKKILDICQKQKSYTIIPTIVIKDRPYFKVKKALKNGALISIDTSFKLNNEITPIIDYIKSKGYKIVSLEKELQE